MLLGVEGESCTVDQGTVASVFRTTHVHPFHDDVPDDVPDDLPMDKEVKENASSSAKEVEENASSSAKEDPPAVITPDIPPT